MTRALRVLRRRRRGAGPRGAGLPARPAPARRAPCTPAASGSEVIEALRAPATVDALFLDIRMPGLDGLDVAGCWPGSGAPPQVVFVTAYDEHAVDAFDLQAVDYLLKPVRAGTARRGGPAGRRRARHRRASPSTRDADETIPVELGGVTRFIQRSDVRYVEAHGDYARLHTADGSHLVRVPLTTLEEQWRDAGFVRIHRSHLVALAPHRRGAASTPAAATVRLGDAVLHGEPAAHPRAARPAGAPRPRPGQPPVTEPPTATPGPRSSRPRTRATRAAAARTGRDAEIDEQTGARRGLHALAGAHQLRLAIGVCLHRGWCCRRRSAADVRARARAVRRRRAAGMPLPWLLLGVVVYPVLVARGLVVRAPGRAQRARLRRPGR